MSIAQPPSRSRRAAGPTAAISDVQARQPAIPIALTRVGLTGVEKVIRVGSELYYAQIDCSVELGGDQKGAHMSRFEEVVNETIGEVVLRESPLHAETLARHIAERVRLQQRAERAEVRIAARYPEYKPAPVSGVQTQEIYTLLGSAVASAHGTRSLVGVQATGMTACPCAQELIAARASERLAAEGFAGEQIERIMELVPVATHNQRGVGTLQVGRIDCGATQQPLDAAELLAIVEQAMSSEIYELMKRSDEVEVVERAHARPRFVEDCVREMIAGVARELPWLEDDSFIFACQENLETIHQHNVCAERWGLLGDLRAELRGGRPTRATLTREQWLAG